MPQRLRMVVLCSRPNYELRAFQARPPGRPVCQRPVPQQGPGCSHGVPRQELNDRRLTLCEGSALSERDLVRTRAEAASAVLLLADRFSPSVHQEDLSIQFQVRAPFHQAALHE